LIVFFYRKPILLLTIILEPVLAYDILADDLLKPERPEIVPAKAYAEVALTEFLDFETIVANVVSRVRFADLDQPYLVKIGLILGFLFYLGCLKNDALFNSGLN